jgi:hypothetical protein
MSDNVAVTPGSGKTVLADEVTDGTLGTGVVQMIKIMDGTLDGTTKAAVGARGLAVDIGAAAAAIAKAEDVASADADVGVPAMAVRKATPANTSGTDGDYEMLQMSAGRLWTDSNVRFAGTTPDLGAGTSGTATQRVIMDSSQLASLQTTSAAMSAGYQLVGLPTDLTWPKGLSNKAFVAAFTTLTRPANTIAYTALDSISDNATAGSVTALSATVSDTNDDPIFVNEILISSTDTGLAGKRIRAYLFNSDPTASTGVGGGDNAAYSQKKAGYIGSFSGVLESGFSDGTVGRLVPTFADGAAAGTPHAMAGGFITVKPTSGAKTLFIQYQAVDGFTPSANSTTIIGTARGWQGRAA